MKNFISAFALLASLSFATQTLAAEKGINLFNGDKKWAKVTENYEGKKIALVLHGYSDHLESFEGLADFLSKHYDVVLGFEYQSENQTVETSSAALSAGIEALAGKNQIHIVAHSLGGLVSRHALKNGLGAKIKHLITLGTPHNGLAGYQRVNNYVALANMGAMFAAAMAKKAPVQIQIPQPINQLFSESQFIKDLNKDASPYCKDAKYCSIQGDGKNRPWPQHLEGFRGLIAGELTAVPVATHDGLVPCTSDSCLDQESDSFKAKGTVVLKNMGHFDLRGSEQVYAKILEIIKEWE